MRTYRITIEEIRTGPRGKEYWEIVLRDQIRAKTDMPPRLADFVNNRLPVESDDYDDRIDATQRETA